MKQYKDILGGGIVIAAAIAIYNLSNQIQTMVQTQIGPDFMPKLVSIIMGVLGMILVFQSIIRLRLNGIEPAQKKEPLELKKIFKQHLDVVTLVLIGIYVFGISKLGFIISTIFYIFCQIQLMSINKKKNYGISGLIAVVFSVLIYIIFTKVLHVMLPAGILG